MEHSQTLAANPGLAESLSPVEFDAERESFQATHDSTHDSTSSAFVAVVATALGRDPPALTPLQSVIETDESPTGHGHCDSISFRYDGFEISATGEDVIEANPIGNA